MHRVQQFVIMQLAENDQLRYSDMKSKGMEPGQFMYHLNLLVDKGLVAKTAKTYALTPLGIQFVDRLSENDLMPFSYPRIALALIYKSKDKGVLLSKRIRQPGIGMAGFLLVDVPLDFTPPLSSMAIDTFRKLTGKVEDWQHRADGYIRVISDNRLIANMMTHVYMVEGNAFTVSDELVWQNDIDAKDIIESSLLVLGDLAKNDSHFFFEHTISI